MVFSTLHTNNAAGVIPRLIDLQVNPKILVSALSLSIAQRLVRKLCVVCKKEKEVSNREKEVIKQIIEGTNPSANALTVENGNVVIYNANSWGGGAGSELLDESAGPTTTKWSRSGNFTLPGTTAVFSGAGTGYITQTTGNMLGSVKPNTQYQLSYTITGASGSCSTFINDPTQAATTTAPASIQSHDTSWRRFGSTNYSSCFRR
jgi:hypothetical protein